jgi:hypothetical protein
MKPALNVAEVGCKILIDVLPKITEEILRFPGVNFSSEITDIRLLGILRVCTNCTLRDRHFAALSARVPLAHSSEIK